MPWHHSTALYIKLVPIEVLAQNFLGDTALERGDTAGAVGQGGPGLPAEAGMQGQQVMGSITLGPAGNVVVTTAPVEQVEEVNVSPVVREMIQFMNIKFDEYRILITYNNECRELVRWICSALSAVAGSAININNPEGNQNMDGTWSGKNPGAEMPWWRNVAYFAKANIATNYQLVAEHLRVLQQARQDVGYVADAGGDAGGENSCREAK